MAKTKRTALLLTEADVWEAVSLLLGKRNIEGHWTPELATTMKDGALVGFEIRLRPSGDD